MPRVNPQSLAPSQIYGKQKVDNNLTFGERLRKKFRPTDTVKVRNITNHAIDWQWLDEQDESYVIEDGSNVKIVTREDPQLWSLGPGEVDILQGSCAYLMIEALYKQTCALKTGIVLHPLDEREIRNFAFDDPAKQEEFIDYCFEGKVTPQMMQEAAVATLGTDFAPKVLEHLPSVTTEQDEYERRTNAQREEAKRRMPTPPASSITSLQDEFEGKPAAKAETSDVPPAQETPTAKVELGGGVVGDVLSDEQEPEAPAEQPVKPLNRSKVSKAKVPAEV